MSKLCVDMVKVAGGPQLYGAVTRNGQDGSVSIAVERRWLSKTYAGYYEELVTREASAIARRSQLLRDRIRDWMKRRSNDGNLVLYLQRELERIEKTEADRKQDANESLQFVLIDVPANEIQRIILQPAERKQVALVAWRERLKDVTVRSAATLSRELKERNVDLAGQAVDLSDRVALLEVESDQQWAARVALVEYRMRRQLNYQGTGNYVVRTGAGAHDVDLKQLFGEVLKEQLGSELSQLLGEAAAEKAGPTWFETAVAEARREDVSGVRVSRLSKDIRAKRVVVEIDFLARMPDDSWQRVLTVSRTAEVGGAPRELQQQVAAAPRVKAVLDLVKAAGLAAGEGQLELALGFGAATMQAQEAANTNFHEVLEKYLPLDSPPLVWSKN